MEKIELLVRKNLLTYEGLFSQDKKISEVAESLDEKEFKLCKAIFSGRKTSVELIEEQREETAKPHYLSAWWAALKKCT